MFPDSEPSAAPEHQRAERSADARVRRFLGPAGLEWRVREAPLPAFDRRTGFCLIFETAEIVRRVRDYPANWFELDDTALTDLCVGPAARDQRPSGIRVCFFDRQDGAAIRELPNDALAPEVWHDGQRYVRYRLSLLASGREVLDAPVYCAVEPSPREELAIFTALFPERGGVFQLVLDA